MDSARREPVESIEPVVAVEIPKAEEIEPVAVAVKPQPVYVPSGDWVAQCKAWAAQAGVPLPSAAITLIDRESDCDPCVISGGVVDCNYTGPKAWGIPQSLPSTKMGCGPDPICQIKWMYSYVLGRYGSWEAALSHSYAVNWY